MSAVLLDVSPYLITFRLLHILAAIAWVGSATFFFFFVEPTARALGPRAEEFMGHLIKNRNVPWAIQVFALTTVTAGGFLYWHDSNGFKTAWITSDQGIVLTIGAVAAVIAFIFGLVVITPAVFRMGVLGQEIRASGGPPTEDQMARLMRTQRTLSVSGRIDMALLIIAALTMSIARYVSF